MILNDVHEQTCHPFAADCQVRAAVELINHTWDPVVLATLRTGPIRRRELLSRIAGVSDKVLSDSLRRLSARRLVARTASDHDRGAAVYELTSLGASFVRGPLLQLAEWAAENQEEISA